MGKKITQNVIAWCCGRIPFFYWFKRPQVRLENKYLSKRFSNKNRSPFSNVLHFMWPSCSIGSGAIFQIVFKKTNLLVYVTLLLSFQFFSKTFFRQIQKQCAVSCQHGAEIWPSCTICLSPFLVWYCAAVNQSDTGRTAVKNYSDSGS